MYLVDYILIQIMLYMKENGRWESNKVKES